MTFGVLFVCTGNICRSPTAERLLRHRLADGPPGLASSFEVTSAGTGALVGHPIHEHAAALVSRVGADAGDFSAQLLSPDLLEDADLVLAMTRAHRAECATLVPRVLPRLFTLLEFARLATAAAADGPAADASPARSPEERARALVAASAGKRGLVRPERPEDDDVPDPYGGPAAGYREPFDRIDAATRVIADLLSDRIVTA